MNRQRALKYGFFFALVYLLLQTTTYYIGIQEIKNNPPAEGYHATPGLLGLWSIMIFELINVPVRFIGLLLTAGKILPFYTVSGVGNGGFLYMSTVGLFFYFLTGTFLSRIKENLWGKKGSGAFSQLV